MGKKVAIIGSGFAGLSAASHLAKDGYEVSIFEKNEHFGGRARQYKTDGFTFDMGPSWYWMPEIFEKFYNTFGKKASDFYELIRLKPSYRVFFGDEIVEVPSSLDEIYELFESIEPGSAVLLQKFMKEAEYKYRVGVDKMVYKPGLSLLELVDSELITGLFKLDVLNSFSSYIRKYFKNPKLLSILEFPILFLGAMPSETPALYSLMNYADLALGTWYPIGGMYEVVNAMVSIAEEQGVKLFNNSPVEKIVVEGNTAKGVLVNGQLHEFDIVIGGADYAHIEQKLLDNRTRNYSDKYWDKRVMAPSSILYYVGFDKKLKNLEHHNLFFDKDFDKHAVEIYKDPKWPTEPLFYVSVGSLTDNTIAPEGKENMVILIPLAPDLEDTTEIRKKYFDIVIERMEKLTDQELRSSIITYADYAHKDFIKDYNAFKGNAYGLANTLMQTANLKPSIRSKRVHNLFFTGQLTVPGPGVPPSIISGEVVSKVVKKYMK